MKDHRFKRSYYICTEFICVFIIQHQSQIESNCCCYCYLRTSEPKCGIVGSFAYSYVIFHLRSFAFDKFHLVLLYRLCFAVAMLISSVLNVFGQFSTFASLNNLFYLFFLLSFYSFKFSEAFNWILSSKLIKSIRLSILFQFTGGNRTVCLIFHQFVRIREDD